MRDTSTEQFDKPRSTKVRSLNLDIALSRCGWSVTDLKEKTTAASPISISVVRWGNITPTASVNRVINNARRELFGNRMLTLIELQDMVEELVDLYHPDYIVTEDTFICKFPAAFASLEQAITAVGLLCYRKYNKPLFRIPTKKAKLAITGSGSADKEGVLSSILNHPNIQFKQKSILTELDHHSADSIAVGYDFLVRVYPGLQAASLEDPV